MKKKVLLWGAGRYLEYVYKMINDETAEVIGIIDSNINKQGKEWRYGILVFNPSELNALSYDYVLVTVQKDKAIEQTCKDLGVQASRLLFFWRDGETHQILKNRMMLLSDELNRKEAYRARLDSAPYEWGIKKSPDIISSVNLLEYICENKASLCRFGDGEFEIMLNRDRAWFQKKTDSLMRRLQEIVRTDSEKICIAIAQDFNNLEKYKEESADIIRIYMEGDTRQDIMTLLSDHVKYYDAYVSRPYILYRNRVNADRIFPLFKKIWDGRNVLMVEGSNGRTGINNDLFASASSVKRIVCPDVEAWGKYNEILNSVENYTNKNDLVCISLGPTATVLAYDLANKGIQALDIGQLDNEYDWYCMGVSERSFIPGKFVAEISMHNESSLINSDEYKSQIVNVIS